MGRLGISLPHRANEQAKLGRTVPEAQARPGDLIFWSRGADGYYHHTAIYLGNGCMISADNESMGINIEPICWREQTTSRTYLP
jgi:putative peptidase